MIVLGNIHAAAVQGAFNEVIAIIRRKDKRFGVENDFREQFDNCQTDSERMKVCYRWLKLYNKKVQVLQ